MVRKILLAYDGTREGRVALLECGEIAPLLHAELHLLAVMRVPSGVFLAEGYVPEAVMMSEKLRFQEIVEEGVALLKKGGYAAQGHLAFGEPVEAICRKAEELGAELIVVGHRKQTSFAARWWKGSVGMSLLECAPCSVLIAIGK
ncbi:MAG TPA: universal stress protein [Candidatus Deferrimicrobiaceae bacterium]